MNVAELKEDLRRHGIGRALVRAAYYRAHSWPGLRVYRFMVLEPERINRELLTRAVPYECRLLAGADLEHLAAHPAVGVTAETLATAVRNGHCCYVFYDGAEPVSWGWYSRVACSVDSGSFLVRFEPRYAYMFNGYTKPEHRGRNLHGIGLARATEALCARGSAGVVTLAERVNFASLRSAHRVGYRDCGLAVCVSLGGLTRIWHSRGPERYGLRLEPGTAARASATLDEVVS